MLFMVVTELVSHLIWKREKRKREKMNNLCFTFCGAKSKTNQHLLANVPIKQFNGPTFIVTFIVITHTCTRMKCAKKSLHVCYFASIPILYVAIVFRGVCFVCQPGANFWSGKNKITKMSKKIN